MTSREKVRAALDRLEAIADDQTIQLDNKTRALALGAAMFRPQLEAALPADAEQLDMLLQKGADWFLACRSDNATPIALEVGES